jgi:hypothetical protein
MTAVVEHKVPGIVLSDESSTRRKNLGKVRKLPVLSAIKLHPLNQ